MPFTCKKCGGEKKTRAAKCKAPCSQIVQSTTHNIESECKETMSSEPNVQEHMTEDTIMKSECESTEQKHTDDVCMDTDSPCFFQENSVVNKYGFTEEELEILRKPFDDPLFEICTNHYVDAFEYILSRK